MAGVTPETRLFFKGGADALRRHGLIEEANEIEKEMARLEELAVKYRLIFHTNCVPLPGAGQ